MNEGSVPLLASTPWRSLSSVGTSEGGDVARGISGLGFLINIQNSTAGKNSEGAIGNDGGCTPPTETYVEEAILNSKASSLDRQIPQNRSNTLLLGPEGSSSSGLRSFRSSLTSAVSPPNMSQGIRTSSISSLQFPLLVTPRDDFKVSSFSPTRKLSGISQFSVSSPSKTPFALLKDDPKLAIGNDDTLQEDSFSVDEDDFWDREVDGANSSRKKELCGLESEISERLLGGNSFQGKKNKASRRKRKRSSPSAASRTASEDRIAPAVSDSGSNVDGPEKEVVLVEALKEHMLDFFHKLRLTAQLKMLASYIGNGAVESGLCMKRNASSLCGASIYLAYNLMGNKITQQEFCHTVGLTEVTLRKVYKELSHYWPRLVPKGWSPPGSLPAALEKISLIHQKSGGQQRNLQNSSGDNAPANARGENATFGHRVTKRRVAHGSQGSGKESLPKTKEEDDRFTSGQYIQLMNGSGYEVTEFCIPPALDQEGKPVSVDVLEYPLPSAVLSAAHWGKRGRWPDQTSGEERAHIKGQSRHHGMGAFGEVFAAVLSNRRPFCPSGLNCFLEARQQ